MPNETDVCNDALSQIGASIITAIDDNSVNANHCQRLYPQLRRSVLRSHHWNFAEARAELAQDAVPPAFEFAFSYALPALLLKIKEYNGANATTTTLTLFETTLPRRYKIEGRKLLTDDGEVKIVYVQDVTDPNIWDGLFYQVITTWLASKLSNAITKDSTKATELLTQVIDVLLPMAAAVDGQEGSEHPFRVDDLIWGR